MRKVFRVTGLSAKVADCIGAKPIVVSEKQRSEKERARIAAKRARNSDVIDMCDLLNVKAFASPVPANRRPMGHNLSQRVPVR